MIIAHATTVHPRGDTRIAVKEAATLNRVAGRVTLYVQDGEGDGTGPGGVRVVDTGPRPASRLARMTCGAWRMARAVTASHPDVVQFHDPELIPMGFWWKLHGIRVIYDAHEDLPRQVMTKPWLPAPLRRPIASLVAAAERLAGRAFDGVAAATPTIAARFPAARTALVQNFPDLDELTFTSPVPHRERPPHVLYLGGVSAIRGIETMVGAMARVRMPGARLKLAGTFQPPELEAHMQALDGWQRIDHQGWADRTEVRRLLSEARLGLVILQPVPSYLDAQPVKMFEYMAAGLPVIASDFPQWRSLVEDIGCAVFVDPLNADALAEAIDRLLSEPELAEEMGARGREAVRVRFNWAQEGEALTGLYRRIAGDPP